MHLSCQLYVVRAAYQKCADTVTDDDYHICKIRTGMNERPFTIVDSGRKGF